MVTHSELLGQKAIQEDLDGFRTQLEAWFASWLEGASDVRILSIDSPPADSGFSSENYIVDLAWLSGPRASQARYVVRRQPEIYRMFPGRDFGFEHRVQDILSSRTSLPVPRIIGHEDDPAVLGGRFYVMSLLDGRTPPSNPSPHTGGMLASLSPDERRRLWFAGVECLGHLHRLDPISLGLGFLGAAGSGQREFPFALRYWEDHYARSSEGRPIDLMSDTARWLRQHVPEERRLLVWGDARIGNMLFDENQACAGMIDWELACLGDPLQDLAYWNYCDDHFAYVAGGALEGWPEAAETIEAYEAAARFQVDRRKLKFYRIYAGYWIVCTLSQLVRIKKLRGQLPSAVHVDETFTPVRFLRMELESA